MTEVPIARVRRVMPAPPDVVFDEWLDPESLAEWMCPRPARCVSITVEPRIGGAVRFDIDDSGRLVLISGHFLTIDRPRSLRFTWSHSGWQDRTSVSIVDVEFEPVGDDQTLLSIEHSMLPAEAFDDHQNGWMVTAIQLAAQLSGRCPPAE